MNAQCLFQDAKNSFLRHEVSLMVWWLSSSGLLQETRFTSNTIIKSGPQLLRLIGTYETIRDCSGWMESLTSYNNTTILVFDPNLILFDLKPSKHNELQTRAASYRSFTAEPLLWLFPLRLCNYFKLLVLSYYSSFTAATLTFKVYDVLSRTSGMKLRHNRPKWLMCYSSCI